MAFEVYNGNGFCCNKYTMKWYHILKYWIAIGIVLGTLQSINQVQNLAISIHRTIPELVALTFDLFPFKFTLEIISALLSFVLTLALVIKLFKYEPSSYKYCAYLLINDIFSGFVFISTADFLGTPSSSLPSSALISLCIRFSLYFSSYIYLKKRDEGLLLGIYDPNNSDVSVVRVTVNNQASEVHTAPIPVPVPTPEPAPAPIPVPVPEPVPTPEPILEEKIYCIYCGKKLPKESHFCPYCGKKVAD